MTGRRWPRRRAKSGMGASQHQHHWRCWPRRPPPRNLAPVRTPARAVICETRASRPFPKVSIPKTVGPPEPLMSEQDSMFDSALSRWATVNRTIWWIRCTNERPSHRGGVGGGIARPCVTAASFRAAGRDLDDGHTSTANSPDNPANTLLRQLNTLLGQPNTLLRQLNPLPLRALGFGPPERPGIA